MVFSTLYNVVDVYFAGMISSEAQAGLAISFQAYFVLVAVGFGLTSALAALVGISVGRKDMHETPKIAAQGISYGIAASLILFFAGREAGPFLISVISEPGGYRDAATQYYSILMYATPGFILAFGLNGILQALGDTISMQRGLIAAFFANLVFNPLFIFGIPGIWGGMGFDGIALSTVLSQTGVMLYIVWRVLDTDPGRAISFSSLWPSALSFQKITALLVPAAFTMVVLILAGFIVQYHLKSIGLAAVAAYGVALRVEQLFLLPVFGLTGALLPIVSQNYGAGDFDRVRQSLFDCWKIGGLFMCIACPLLLFAAPAAMRIFTSDPDVIRIGVSYLRIDGIILPAYMMLFAINSFLQGLEKPAWSLWIGIYRQFFALAGFIWLFTVVMDLGANGVWLGIAASVVTGLCLSLYVVRRVTAPMIGDLWQNAK